MKIITLLENQQPTNKQITRFLYVLQECLITKYPEYKTVIAEQIDDPADLPLCINWYIKNKIIEVTIEKTTNSITIFWVWFKFINKYSHSKINDFYNVEELELDFDIIDKQIQLIDSK